MKKGETLETFPASLQADRYGVSCLWKPDGSQAATIWIVKEIWLNIGGKGDGRGDGSRYPVFHIYNYLDPSRAHSPDSGCRVNPLKEPYLEFAECLAVAKQMEQEALQSGQWVRTEQLEQTQPRRRR
ncbi:MAG: hypothetical protein HY006_01825 [Candidatus Sungbacteria bacterium]|nr:hypothetical protein [Candidatus Sungbacteria bacterium]